MPKKRKHRGGIREHPKGSGIFQARYRKKGKEISHVFPKGTVTREEAKAWLAQEMRNQVIKPIDVLRHKILEKHTLKEIVQTYITEITKIGSRSEKAKRPLYVQALADWIKRTWYYDVEFLESFLRYETNKQQTGLADKFLHQITDRDWETYRDRRLSGAGPYSDPTLATDGRPVVGGVEVSTLQRQLSVLRNVYRYASGDLEVPLTFPKLKFPKTRKKPKRPPPRVLEPEELRELLDATLENRGDKHGAMWRALILAALYTAMRGKELRLAKWEHIDWNKVTWSIPGDNVKSLEGRTIPISKRLRDSLQSYMAELPPEDREPDRPVFVSIRKDLVEVSRIENFSLITRKQRRYRPLSDDARDLGFRRLLKAAGIKNFAFHMLKHTALTNFHEKPIELSEPQSNYMADHHDKRYMRGRYVKPDIEGIRAKLDADYQEPLVVELDVARTKQLIRSLLPKDMPTDKGYLELSPLHLKFLEKLDWSTFGVGDMFEKIISEFPQPSEKSLNEKVVTFDIKSDRNALVPLSHDYSIKAIASDWMHIDPRMLLDQLKTRGMCVYNQCVVFTPEGFRKFIEIKPELPVS
jgi:integrase